MAVWSCFPSNTLWVLLGGAEIVTTGTYQASVDGFRKHLNLDRESSLNLMREAVALAFKAVDTFMQENPGANREYVYSYAAAHA